MLTVEYPILVRSESKVHCSSFTLIVICCPRPPSKFLDRKCLINAKQRRILGFNHWAQRMIQRIESWTYRGNTRCKNVAVRYTYFFISQRGKAEKRMEKTIEFHFTRWFNKSFLKRRFLWYLTQRITFWYGIRRTELLERKK